MKYLVVLHEVAYITHNVNGKEVLDAWDAPHGKWFQPQTLEIPEEFTSSEAFKAVKILEKLY